MIRLRSVRLAAVVSLCLAACSHDTERANPLDATLTPAVTLAASIDSTGTVALSWSPYDGATRHAQTLVLRNVANSVLVDTLARLTDASITAWRDTSLQPDVAYEYRVSVVNDAGLEIASQSRSVEGFRTSPVAALSAIADPADGTIRLTWPEYRDPRFTEYVVIRRLAEATSVDTLARLDSPAATTFLDTSARHQIDYLYRVDVVAAGRSLSGTAALQRLLLPAVEVLTQADSRTGSVGLSWNAYTGPRFAAYEIMRAVGASTELVATIVDHDSTRFIDTGLRGDTPHEYWLQVHTTADEVVVGAPSPASFHSYDGSFELPLEGGTATTEYVRLLSASADTVVVFVPKHENSVRRISVHGETQDTLRTYARFDDSNQQRLSTRLDAAQGDGSVIWEMQFANALVAYRDGKPAWSTTPVISDLHLPFAVESDSVSVSLRFELVNAGVESQLVRGIRLESRQTERSVPGPFRLRRGIGAAIGSRAFDWMNFTLAGTIEPQTETVVGLGLSSLVRAEFKELLRATFEPDAVVLTWDLADSSDTVSQRFPRESYGISPFRVELRMESGQLSLDLHSAARWGRTGTAAASWSSLATHDGDVLFTVDDEAFVLPAGGTVRELGTLTGGLVAETRVWSIKEGSDAESRFPRVGICYPDEDLVNFGTMPATTVWSRSVTTNRVGPRLTDREAGRLFNPISLAGGADGRVYILDAGNARIVVVDQEGNYITQFGRPGSGPGEFDFGSGNRIEGGRDYRGSILVGDDGRIYVADPGNQRIQVFEP